MKKSEIKKAFDENFSDITVSDELKEKTLKKIHTLPLQRPSHLPYLKNFAAIFIVTVLCLSIYFRGNFKQINSINSISHEKITYDLTENIENEILNYEDTATDQLKSRMLTSETSISTTFGNKSELSQAESTQDTLISPLSLSTQYDQDVLNGISLQEDTEEKNVMSEDEFLILYPSAEKVENGYKIYQNNKEIIYIFNNGNLEDTIIIE